MFSLTKSLNQGIPLFIYASVTVVPKNILCHTFRMKGHATKLYPSHWPNSIAEGSAIDVSNKVFEHLKENFQESIKKSVRIISIKEICNHDYYDRYERFD